MNVLGYLILSVDDLRPEYTKTEKYLRDLKGTWYDKSLPIYMTMFRWMIP